MAVKRKFTFKISTLLYDGDLILVAAETQTAFATKRLATGLLTSARALCTSLGGKGSSAQSQISATGTLTKAQNDAIHDLLESFGNLKDSAKRAFPGDDVKLREEFQVGINSPNDLGSVLDRAKKAADAAEVAANAAALKDKGGWIAEDVTKLRTAITAVGTIDKAQQTSYQIQLTGTDARNTAANTLFDNLLTIQNAANLEWPESDTNRGTRAAFRLGTFPPERPHTAAAKKTASPGASSTP